MRRAVALEAVGAIIAIVVAVVCWNAGVQVHRFAAVPGGAPEFSSTKYSGSSIAAATVCVAVAAVLVIDAVRRLVSGRSHTG